ncbi:MAG TPA: OmpA family protein [Rhodocyclaceae bacterium]|nr:OmpA family protein [Rhodocyclaceae bacterium]
MTKLSLFPYVAVAMLVGALPACSMWNTADPAGGGASGQPSSSSSSAAPAPIPVEVFEAAILSAANTLLGKASLPPDSRRVLVIDPLIDGMTGEQTASTRSMGERIARLAREQYAQRYTVQPFNRTTVVRAPLVLIGTLTPINRDGKTEGRREIYRICLALADLSARRIVGKGVARAELGGVDGTATTFYLDSPAWGLDAGTAGYIKTCQGTRPGDAMDPAYLDRIVLGALLSEAVDHYNAGRYKQALDAYADAEEIPGGADELRVLNGLYLSNMRLKRNKEAAAAFDRIVDNGFRNNRLSVKLLFRPNSVEYVATSSVSGAYPMWLNRIALAATRHPATCVNVSGHSGMAGGEAERERIARLRAEAVRNRLVALQPALAKRVTAVGLGSREALVGTGRDDASDVLDRRVVFKLAPC